MKYVDEFSHLHSTQFFFNSVSASLDVQLSNVHFDHNFVDVRLRLSTTQPSHQFTRVRCASLTETSADKACQPNALEFRGNYSVTSNNTKLVHWPLMGGLLHLVQRGGDWAGCGLA